jgi:hypothetical protein
MRENVLMCALFGELSMAERVLKYRVVNKERQARELGVFSFLAGVLRLWGMGVRAGRGLFDVQ